MRQRPRTGQDRANHIFSGRLNTNLRTARVEEPLLFHIDKASLGMARTDEATPWDDCPNAKSNANTFVGARAYRVF